MERNSTLTYWNRETQALEVEQIYGENWLKWAYETTGGRSLTELFFSRPWLSKIYGLFQDTPWSKRKIGPFIRDFKIRMSEFEGELDGSNFQNFNEFFTRNFRPGVRPFEPDSNRMSAPAEARYFGFESVLVAQPLPIKGLQLNAARLLDSPKKAVRFEGGPALVARLCPVDYHRFHFPDDGEILEQFTLPGHLHSVNPIALMAKKDIFALNERVVSILKTKNFGTLAYIEVGALCVGKIVQRHSPLTPFLKGQEKGYFLFGGSTVVILGEKGAWKPDPDILENTLKGREVLVKLGHGLAGR